MPTQVIADFRRGVDNRGVDADGSTLAGVCGGHIAENFTVGKGGLVPRTALTNLPPQGLLFKPGGTPPAYEYRFNGAQPIFQHMTVSGGTIYATVGGTLCILTPNTSGGIDIRPIWNWPSATAFTVATLTGNTYLAPETVPADQQTQNHMVRSTAFNLSVQMTLVETNASYDIWRLDVASAADQILPGDVMFFGFRDDSASPITLDWAPTGSVVSARVEKVFRCTIGGVMTFFVYTPVVAKPAGGYNVANIARTGLAGIPIQNSAATVNVTSGGNLPEGSVQYLWRFSHSAFNLTSVPSDVVTSGGTNTFQTTASNKTVQITLPIATLQRPPGTDSVLLYRRVKPSGGVWSDWYLAANLPCMAVWESATESIGGTQYNGLRLQYLDEISFTDTGQYTGSPLPGDAYFHDPPPALRWLVAFNGRLYAIGRGASASEMLFSTANAPEYWPRDAAGILSFVTDTTWLGGYQSFAGGGLVAIVPEGGAFSTTGQTGDNLLVFQRHQAHRWFGVNWSDFRLVYAFNVGCAAPFTVQNCGGVIIWRSSDHLMAVPAGSPNPEVISEALAPPRASEETVDGGRSVYRDGVYIYNHGTRNWAFDISSRAWTPMDHGYRYPASTLGHSSFPPNTLVWCHPTQSGLVREAPGPFAGGMKCITQVLRPGQQPDHLRRDKRFRRVHVGLRRAGVSGGDNATLTVWLYTNSSTTPLSWTRQIPGTTTVQVAHCRVALPVDPPVIGLAAQLVIELSPPSGGSLSRDWALEWIMVDWEELAADVDRDDVGGLTATSGNVFPAGGGIEWPIDPP